MKNAVIKLVVGSLTSKLLGFFRETLFAAWFGTSEVAAAYRIAQSVVLTFINALVGDTLTSGLIPLYQKTRTSSKEVASALLLAALAFSLLIGLALGGLVFWFAPLFVDFFAPGANEIAKTLAAAMIRIMATAVPVVMLGNTVAFIEAAHDRYKSLSSRASLTNVGIIITAAAAAFFDAPIILAYGYVAVYTLFMLWAFLDLKKFGHVKSMVQSTKSNTILASKQLWLNTFSLLGLPLAAQITGFVERIIASKIDTAVIPALDYARFLSETLVVLSAVPLGIAMLAKKEAMEWDNIRNDAAKFGSLLLALFVPVSVVFFFCSEDIIRLIYMRGAFNEHSAELTSSIFRGQSMALSLIVTAYFFQKALNKSMKNRQLLEIIVFAAFCNIAFISLFWKTLGSSVLGYGNCVYGLAMFAGTTTVLKIWKNILPLFTWVLGGMVVALLLLFALPHYSSSLVNIFIASSVVTALWACLYVASPPIQSTLAPLINQGVLKFRRKK